MNFSIDKLTMAMEGIAFQPNSKLSKELMEIFRELKEYPDTIKINPRTNFNDIFYDTLTFFEKTTVPKFQKCVRAHTGIIIEKVYCREFYPPKTPLVTYSFFVACVKPNQDPKKLTATKWWEDALDVISGAASKEAHVKAESAAQMEKVISNFDDEVGRFKIAEDLDELITAHMGLDLGSMCFTDKILHEKLLPLTVEEITAIVLHELGHILATVSYLKYSHYSISTLKGSFEHFMKYAKDEEKSKFIQSNTINKLSSSVKNPITKVLLEKCQKISLMLDNKISTPTSGVITVLVILFKIRDLILNITASFILFPLYRLMKLLNYAMYNINLSDSDKGPKQSDLKVFNVQLHEAERIADEFVVKHNMGSYIQEGLKKVYDGVTFMRGTYGATAYNGHNNALFHLANFFGLVSELLDDFNFGTVGVHPESAERAEMVARMQVQNIRASEDNPFKLNLALKEYERVFNNAKNKSNRDKLKGVVEKISNLLDDIIAIVTMGVISFTQRRQIDALVKSAIALMDNDIYVSAMKLNIMLNDMKK